MDSLWVIKSPGKHFRRVPITGLNPTRVVTRATRFPSVVHVIQPDYIETPGSEAGFNTRAFQSLRSHPWVPAMKLQISWCPNSTPTRCEPTKSGRATPTHSGHISKVSSLLCLKFKKPIYFSSEKVTWNNKRWDRGSVCCSSSHSSTGAAPHQSPRSDEPHTHHVFKNYIGDGWLVVSILSLPWRNTLGLNTSQLLRTLLQDVRCQPLSEDPTTWVHPLSLLSS